MYHEQSILIYTASLHRMWQELSMSLPMTYWLLQFMDGKLLASWPRTVIRCCSALCYTYQVAMFGQLITQDWNTIVTDFGVVSSHFRTSSALWMTCQWSN